VGVIDRIEKLVFQPSIFASVEIVKNRIILVKMRCVIKRLTLNECHLLTDHGTLYKISGEALQIKEYGDAYVKVAGEKITSFFIEEGR